MPNRLVGSTSPYLLQHQNNPVDWYPWGEEALKRAVELDRPIFLSIGYSACHWCHVMEHESFENPAIAEILNQHFVSIKVDREQRPDLDHIYMQVVQMLTGSGGWPMSVFLTPTARPFYGGTYWPPENRWGRPGFSTVLRSVAEAWVHKRQAILDQSDEIVEHLQARTGDEEREHSVAFSRASVESLLDRADQSLLDQFDPRYGGFGGAPKFPHTMDLRFLMRRQRTKPSAPRETAILRTLDGMAQGGIYDHLGGGFARYSVDDKWLVPHFEKMLYDNALLASTYLDAFRLTQRSEYAQVVRETLDYVLRDMTDVGGGFYSAEDADSEGEEGKFYVWSQSEIRRLLGDPEASLFEEVYGVTAGGNFEGHNILHLPRPLEEVGRRRGLDLLALQESLEASRRKLLDARSQRIRPLRDDKILVAWNALMIIAMAEAGVVLGQPTYSQAARKACLFLLDHLRDAQGRWLHVWRAGKAEIGGFLDDYAYMAAALLTLWESDHDPRWLDEAGRTIDAMVELFSDPNGGSYFFTAHDAEKLIARAKDAHDGSVPSGNSMAAWSLLRHWRWTNRDQDLEAAHAIIDEAMGWLHRATLAAGQWLNLLDDWLTPDETWVVLVRGGESDSRQWRQQLLPLSSIATKLLVLPVASDGKPDAALIEQVPLWLAHRHLPEEHEVVLYRCRDTTCDAPIFGKDEIFSTLSAR